MTNELDLARVHQTHEPDPAFVTALEQRLEAILAGAAHFDHPSGGNDMTIDLTTERLARLKHRRRWVQGVAALLGAAAAIASIVVVTSGGPSKTVSSTSLSRCVTRLANTTAPMPTVRAVESSVASSTVGLASRIWAATSTCASRNTSFSRTTLPAREPVFLPPRRTSPNGTCSQHRAQS